MRDVRSWLVAGIDQVGGLPPRSSYMWGGRASPLAYVVFHLVALLRVLSPLQWLKQVFRRRTSARRTTNLRLDFPAAFTEAYFLVVLAGCGCLFLGDLRLPSFGELVVRTVAWTLVLEATVWILYYLLLRGLIEGRYTAYHPAEYLLQFPLVVGAQCCLVSLLLQQPPSEVFTSLRGSDGGVPGPVGDVLSLLGLVYLGAGVSSLINSLPVIAARGAEGFVVVGAGDVARRRILPALARLGVRTRELQLLDTAAKGSDVIALSPRGIVDRVAKLRTPVVIATPTSSHLYYVESLAAESLPFAVEKPIVATGAELRRLRGEPQLMERGFALGYYALEKALPVTYLMTRREVYRPFLVSGDGAEPPQPQELDDLVHRLGRATSVHGWILEDAERSPSGRDRAWTEQPPSLGSLVETAVHPLHVAATVVPGLAGFRPSELRAGRYAPRARQVHETCGQGIAPTFVDVLGTVAETEIRITVGKHVAAADAARGLLARFEHGRITADFDGRCAVLELDEGARVELHIPLRYANYEVQMGLFRVMTLRGWAGGRYDQLEQQLDALQAWQAIRAFGREVAVADYDDAAPPAGVAALPRPVACRGQAAAETDAPGQ